MKKTLLELAIEDAQSELKGRESRRMFGWVVLSSLIFFIPAYLFFSASEGSVYESSFGAIVIVWLLVSLGLGNFLAAALLTPRTAELQLLLATSEAVHSIAKAGNIELEQASSEQEAEQTDA